MTKSIGTATLALTLALPLMIGGAAAINPAAAAPSEAAVQTPQTRKTTEPSARRLARAHERYAYRPQQRPYYDDRPSDYAPVPSFPFVFGLGYVP
jgi:hypothetical protein